MVIFSSFIFTTFIFSQNRSAKNFRNVSLAKITVSNFDEPSHKLVGGYYNVTNPFQSKLLLNNKGGNPIEVQPTLYGKNSSTLQVASVTVEGQSYRYVDIADWASQGGEDFEEGNLQLFHRGNDLVIGSQIYITDRSKSLGFENKLSELGKFDSRKLEGIWWNPTGATETDVTLTNTSDEYLIVTANLIRKPNISSEPQIITLLPHETKVLNIRNDFNQGNSFASKKILGLSLQHEGSEDALLAWAMTRDESKGYSNVVTFSNPNKVKSNEYHGAGLQLGKIQTEKLNQVVLLKNTSQVPSVVSIKVPYTKQDGEQNFVQLSDITLSPNEIYDVNMNQLENLREVSVAGIEIKYTGEKGSIIASAQSVSQSKTHVFRTLLWDILGHRSSTGDYPVDIDGTSNSVAYIKNATNREQEYLAYMVYENQNVYVIKGDKLSPNETIKIDVKKLRDEQIPDVWGNVLPPNVTKGQLSWTGFPSEENEGATIPDNLGVIGQMQQVDITKGIHSTYFCESCCVGTYIGSPVITPQNNEIVYGDSSSIDYDVTVGVVSACYPTSIIIPQNKNAQSWSIGNSSIGNINSSGNLSIQGAGKTTVNAVFKYKTSMVEPCNDPPLLTNFAETTFLESLYNSIEDCFDEAKPKGPNVKDVGSEIINAKPMLEPGCGECQFFYTNMNLQTDVTIKPKIKIKRNNSDITGSTQNVIVGEKIELETEISGGPTNNQSWTIPGKTVKDYIITCVGTPTPPPTGTYCSNNPPGTSAVKTELTQLDGNTIQYYWWGGGSQQVKHSATIRGATNEVTSTFNITIPTISVEVGNQFGQRGPIFTEEINQKWWLTHGDELQPGVRFNASVNVPNGYSGSGQWVQIYNALHRLQMPDNSWVRASGNGLDTTYPYSYGLLLNDSPRQPLSKETVNGQLIDFKRAEITDSAKSYFMFKPDKPNSIWVPIYQTNWLWTAEAIRQSNGSYIKGNESAPNPTIVSDIDFPIWTKNVQPFAYVPE